MSAAIVSLKPDPHVEFDDEALDVAMSLSNFAVEVHAACAGLSGTSELEERVSSIDRLVAIMTAIEETLDSIESMSFQIVDEISNKGKFSFCYCSEITAIMVSCKLQRNCYTLSIQKISVMPLAKMTADNDTR